MIFLIKKLYLGGFEFLPLGDKNKSSAHHTKGFCEKKSSKVIIEEFVF